MGCEFCDNICELKQLNTTNFKGYYPDTNKTQIVHGKDGFHIWEDGGGDPFQCGIDTLKNINYCPFCGRKL